MDKKERNLIHNCKACGKEVAKNAKSCPNCGKDQRNFFMRHKVITFILVIFVLSGIGSGMGGNSTTPTTDNSGTTETAKIEATETKKDVPTEEKVEKDVPTEYKSALKKAKTYSDTMSMSKNGVYDQLTSEYGEKFPQEAAQYAIDNVEANWKKMH
ncbi:Ltp family lipoprotein [Romboutsia maritimum]|uniref:Ltp family lipoprotein n=1 Tax=Romboutsia maritimum TaxID=2020948 RepID=UPI001FB10933|nr:Ltp family lipoprotein [Romboutsia maritimum]